MHFRALQLRNFRNFRATDANFSSRLNILLGENGQGKTNLVEALHLLSQGKSFRYGDNSAFIREGANEAFIAAAVERRQLDYKIKLSLSGARKALSINDKRVTSLETRKLFPCVLFSPESLAAIKEGSDHRRSLVDDFLMSHDPQNARLIGDYRHALKTRNRVLKHLAEDDGPRAALMDVLDSLDQRFFELGAELTFARKEALMALEPEIRLALKSISTNSDVDISVDLVVSGESAMGKTRAQIDDAIHKRGADLRVAELSSGTSLVGPHKHDIAFLSSGKDSRFFCSQGQQRAIILAFKMAQTVYHRKAHGFYPVLLLDDVLSELDAGKRKALIAFLHEINTQVFLTTTDLAVSDSFSLHDSKVIHVAGGILS